MALLTADDVLNKKFQPTKFREGYDQDEVDDFLDEVVNTLRVVTGENEELKAKLAAAERRVGEPGGAVAATGAEPGTGTAAPVEPEQTETVTVDEGDPEQADADRAAVERADAERADAQQAGAEQTDGQPVVSAPAQQVDGPQSAAGMLALAQRLHDEYVSNGEEERDRIVAEARTEAERLVREAEDEHNRTLTQLEQERSLLERKIDELQTFERDYRERLTNYLQSLLANVEGRGDVAADPV
ncbi:DivIVA domain-containing protein [Georgenia sp. 10Sc9-8]|uniref:Cell wall synthesis protein Wag31 n=1 Tax=Georgenia halotolerans TaxID=3028317 RepID=A0ABT5TYN9_9MICO|nr:DivIVA domain-containing protein [Georgenia halotolerans]